MQDLAEMGAEMEFDADGVRVNAELGLELWFSDLGPYYIQAARELQTYAEFDSGDGTAKVCPEGLGMNWESG